MRFHTGVETERLRQVSFKAFLSRAVKFSSDYDRHSIYSHINYTLVTLKQEISVTVQGVVCETFVTHVTPDTFKLNISLKPCWKCKIVLYKVLCKLAGRYKNTSRLASKCSHTSPHIFGIFAPRLFLLVESGSGAAGCLFIRTSQVTQS